MYCWGSGWCGQLGQDGGAAEEVAAVPFKRMEPFPQGVLQLACGERHTLFLLQDGTLLSCGDNSRGQLGRRSGDGDHRRGQIQALEAQTIALVSCGKEHSLAVCNRGRVFAWGAGSEGQLGTGAFKEQSLIPKRIDGLSRVTVIQVSCGHFHSIALSKDGRAFSWGQNSHGQLGLGNKKDPQASPQHIKSLHGIPLAQVAAGGSHTLALCLSGAVFGWGKNNAGQLGFHSVSLKGHFRPHAVDALRNLGVIYVTCGDEHTAVLTREGSVFTFGDDTYRQLGHDSKAQETGPQKLSGINGRVSQIACGSYHTLAYSSTSGQIFSFGCGTQRHGEHSTTTNQKQTFPSCQPWNFDISTLVSANDLLDLHVKKMFAGAYVSFVSTAGELQISEPTNGPCATENMPNISRMDRCLINNWTAGSSGSENRQEAKREIVEIFSSAACLTASFIKERCDSSLQASYIDVDLETARTTFAELSKIDWISTTISYSLREHLIPELPCLSSHRAALAIFLILPECSWMHDMQGSVPMVSVYANAVNNLSDAALKILEKWWSSLPATFLCKQVEMLKGAVLQKLQTCKILVMDHMASPILEMLKKLFKANMKANFILEVNKFYINEISQYIDVVGDLANWHTFQNRPVSDKTPFPVIFCRFPFTLNPMAKLRVVCADSAMKQEAAKQFAQAELMQNRMQGSADIPRLPLLHLKVNRNNLVEDTFHKLSQREDCDLRKELLVQFRGESGINSPSVKREFFLYLFEELFQPDYGLFIQCDKYSPVWFPANPSVEKKKYFFSGILCGLVLFNYAIVYLPFPLALYKKLLDKKPTLMDLSELDPVLGRSLQHLLDYEHDDIVAKHEVYFSASWDNKTVDLIPHGSSIVVDNTNKHDYVSKYVDYVFNKSVSEVFDEFKRGFYKVCEEKIIRFFQPQELMDLMTGTTDYDWSKFEQNTVYWGVYHQSHPTIKMFWKVFHDLQLPEKKAFLLFLTGTDRIPVNGIDVLKIRITSHATLTEQHLPEAQTCSLILFLPLYSTVQVLKEKLVQAISHNRGFGKTQQ